MTVALLDGDIIAYRSAVMAEEDVDWGDGGDGLTVNYHSAEESAVKMAERWTQYAKAGKAIVCLSPADGSNYRKLLIDTYKANRRNLVKPKALDAAREALANHFDVVEEPYLEADDLMGIYGTRDPKKYVIVTLDKDMQSLPCRLLLISKEGKPRTRRPVRIKTAQANRFWLTQALTGDAIDGYKGCPGIGPAKAAKAFEGVSGLDDAWSKVLGLFESKGLTEADALLQARLSRILRHGEYDFENKRIRLWTPRPQADWLIPNQE